jgi:hypothetical protein
MHMKGWAQEPLGGPCATYTELAASSQDKTWAQRDGRAGAGEGRSESSSSSWAARGPRARKISRWPLVVFFFSGRGLANSSDYPNGMSRIGDAACFAGFSQSERGRDPGDRGRHGSDNFTWTSEADLIIFLWGWPGSWRSDFGAGDVDFVALVPFPTPRM